MDAMLFFGRSDFGEAGAMKFIDDGGKFDPSGIDGSIERGLADAEAGRTKPADEVFDRLERKYRAFAEARRLDEDRRA